MLPQHIQGDKCRFLTQQADRRSGLFGFGHPQRAQNAPVCEDRIEFCQLLRGHFTAAQDQRQPIVFFPRHPGEPGQTEKLIEIRFAEFCRDIHRRNITAVVQCLCCRQRPHKAQVKVLRRVAAEGGRHIFKNGQRMQHALLQPEGVNKGFQCRAGGTFGIGAVHLAVDLRVVIIRRSHQRPHAHITGINKEHRRIMQPRLLTAGDKSSHLFFGNTLKIHIQRSDHGLRFFSTEPVLPGYLLNQMRGDVRHLFRLAQHQRQFKQCRHVFIVRMLFPPVLPEPVACLHQRLADIRASGYDTIPRRLRQYRQRQGFRQR